LVKKPSRIVALSLVMVLCLLAYRLAEHRLRAQLAATGQTVPNQLKQATDRPTMRWMFQCFEGISLVAFTPPKGPPHRELAGLERLHEQVVALLGTACKNLYKLRSETAKCGYHLATGVVNSSSAARDDSPAVRRPRGNPRRQRALPRVRDDCAFLPPRVTGAQRSRQ
jgi:hypothetical protein